jgi:hypothetical protein
MTQVIYFEVLIMRLSKSLTRCCLSLSLCLLGACSALPIENQIECGTAVQGEKGEWSLELTRPSGGGLGAALKGIGEHVFINGVPQVEDDDKNWCDPSRVAAELSGAISEVLNGMSDKICTDCPDGGQCQFSAFIQYGRCKSSGISVDADGNQKCTITCPAAAVVASCALCGKEADCKKKSSAEGAAKNLERTADPAFSVEGAAKNLERTADPAFSLVDGAGASGICVADSGDQSAPGYESYIVE